jgi:hypothetical protein
MKLIFFIVISFLFLTFWNISFAKRGCCSWHGGVNHCDTTTGRIICNDGTYSPSCMCERDSNNQKFRHDSAQQKINN